MLRLLPQWVLAYSGFPFPLALTLWHMSFCSAVGFICVRVLKLVKSHNMTAREYCTRVMPIGEADRRSSSSSKRVPTRTRKQHQLGLVTLAAALLAVVDAPAAP